MKKRRVGILTGGGDCPGLNAAIKWVVYGAVAQTTANPKNPIEIIALKEEELKKNSRNEEKGRKRHR